MGFPLQTLFVRSMFNQRRQGVVVTDHRVRLVTEVMNRHSSVWASNGADDALRYRCCKASG